MTSFQLSSLPGITNGIDVDGWDPASDKHIPFHYSVDNLSGKVGSLLYMQSSSFVDSFINCECISDRQLTFHHDIQLQAKCKVALQKELGFSIRPECPLVVRKS